MKLPENIERRFLQKFCLNFCKVILLYGVILNSIVASAFERKWTNPLKHQFKEDITYRVFEVKENHFCTYSGTQEGDIFVPHQRLHEKSIQKDDYIQMIQGYKHDQIQNIGTLQGYLSILIWLYWGVHIQLEVKQISNELSMVIQRFEKSRELKPLENASLIYQQIRIKDLYSEQINQINQRVNLKNHEYSVEDRNQFYEELKNINQEVNAFIKNRDRHLQQPILLGRSFLGILAVVLFLSYQYQIKIIESEEPDNVFDELNLGMKPSLSLRKHLKIPFKDIQSLGGITCL
jgi:hypothetical protein